jgi:hypothetical protein
MDTVKHLNYPTGKDGYEVRIASLIFKTLLKLVGGEVGELAISYPIKYWFSLKDKTAT